MAADVGLGPIWRSIRRHRAFSLLILEVTMGFFIVANLIITMRWYRSMGVPASGHREADLVEVVIRAPAAARAAGQEARDSRAADALAALPGVRRVAAVSSTMADDRWAMPTVFWTDAAGPAGARASACAGVPRSPDGVVVGWTVEADATLAETVDLRFVEGQAPTPPVAQVGALVNEVIVTRCLRDALFGGAPALGAVLRSNRHPPARITGVVEDVRMRVPFLYQTQVTAIFSLPPADERVARFLVRVESGRAAEVARAVLASQGGDGDGDRAGDPDRVVTARAFSFADTRVGRTALGTVWLLGVIGVSLGVVAVLGNLAVAAFFVGERRRIIGVRRALGATRWDILRYLLLENLLATQLGNALGLACTLLLLPGAQRRFSGLHFGLADLAATVILLSLGGVVATLLPGWRAARIPPSEVSRAL